MIALHFIHSYLVHSLITQSETMNQLKEAERKASQLVQDARKGKSSGKSY